MAAAMQATTEEEAAGWLWRGLRLEQDRINDGGRKQLGEDAGASSGVLCSDERGGLHAVMGGAGPAGQTIGW